MLFDHSQVYHLPLAYLHLLHHPFRSFSIWWKCLFGIVCNNSARDYSAGKLPNLHTQQGGVKHWGHAARLASALASALAPAIRISLKHPRLQSNQPLQIQRFPHRRINDFPLAEGATKTSLALLETQQYHLENQQRHLEPLEILQKQATKRNLEYHRLRSNRRGPIAPVQYRGLEAPVLFLDSIYLKTAHCSIMTAYTNMCRTLDMALELTWILESGSGATKRDECDKFHEEIWDPVTGSKAGASLAVGY